MSLGVDFYFILFYFTFGYFILGWGLLCAVSLGDLPLYLGAVKSRGRV
tara:strand:+ start:569 stop:712 length:144 start_codon:yes stop_codon:yes gene_type:complete